MRAGKVRYIGASSMYAWQFSKALYVAERHGWTRFVSMQNHYNLLYREEEREMNAAVPSTRASVSFRGALSRAVGSREAASATTTSRSQTDRFGNILYAATGDADGRIVERVDAMAKARGVPNAQIALAWMLRQKGVAAPIIGATKMEHLDDAVAALSVKLSDEEAKSLEEPYVPHAVAGFR